MGKKKVGIPKLFGKKGGGGDSGIGPVLVSIFVFFAILFVLLGGVNQRKALERMHKLGNDIGRTMSIIFNKETIDINEDGVYLRP